MVWSAAVAVVVPPPFQCRRRRSSLVATGWASPAPSAQPDADHWISRRRSRLIYAAGSATQLNPCHNAGSRSRTVDADPTRWIDAAVTAEKRWAKMQIQAVPISTVLCTPPHDDSGTGTCDGYDIMRGAPNEKESASMMDLTTVQWQQGHAGIPLTVNGQADGESDGHVTCAERARHLRGIVSSRHQKDGDQDGQPTQQPHPLLNQQQQDPPISAVGVASDGTVDLPSPHSAPFRMPSPSVPRTDTLRRAELPAVMSPSPPPAHRQYRLSLEMGRPRSASHQFEDIQNYSDWEGGLRGLRESHVSPLAVSPPPPPQAAAGSPAGRGTMHCGGAGHEHMLSADLGTQEPSTANVLPVYHSRLDHASGQTTGDMQQEGVESAFAQFGHPPVGSESWGMEPHKLGQESTHWADGGIESQQERCNLPITSGEEPSEAPMTTAPVDPMGPVDANFHYSHTAGGIVAPHIRLNLNPPL